MAVKDLTIVYRNPADLVAYDKNTRTHTEAQVTAIAAAIREFGFTNPILLKDDERTIGAGHARQRAAKVLGLDTVPTVTLHGLSDEQWRAYIVADNRLAEAGSGWDAELLRLEMTDLKGLGFDVSLTGFSFDEIDDIIRGPTSNRGDPDFVPDTPKTPVSLLGDMWMLGKHLLVCGDCTDPEVVEKVLAGHRPNLMVTDPPYGVNYDPNWRNDRIGVNTNRVGVVENDNRADWREAWALFPGNVAYIWTASLQLPDVGASLTAVGFELRSLIIWNKARLVPGRGHYHWKHEPCFYAVRKGASGQWVGGRKQSTVWDIANRDQDVETSHGTQKPVECMLRPIQNNSKPGDHVYEPFSGSGTTIIAAQQAKRICHAIELNPVYVDVAIARWQAFTGETVTLAATGQTFDQVKDERAAQPAPKSSPKRPSSAPQKRRKSATPVTA